MKSFQTKAEHALKTIGETAQIIDVPSHVLRFWETKFSNIKPVNYNNRRYYNLENIELLKKIKSLLYEQNYSIKDAVANFKKKILVSNNISALVKVRDRMIKAKNKLNAVLQK